MGALCTTHCIACKDMALTHLGTLGHDMAGHSGLEGHTTHGHGLEV